MTTNVTTERVPANKLPFQRWGWALILAAMFLLAIHFNARLTTMRQMSQDEARLKQSVQTEEARQVALTAMRDYVASDSYVEHWARVEARMVKPNEVPVIPVAPRVTQAAASPAPQARAPATILDEWWSLFFGETSQTSSAP